jgi:serine acetyltransferase
MSLTFKETMHLFRADLHRRLALEGRTLSTWNAMAVFFSRGVFSVLIYRLKRYLYLKNSTLANVFAWMLRFPEFHICHNELDPRAEIGPGLVLNDRGGVAISYANIIGKNCTFMGRATPTLGAMEDVNIEEDRIRIGDYCTIGPNVRIINPVTIADGVQIKANTVVMATVKHAGALISGFPARTVTVIPMDSVKAWSPLLSQFLPALSIPYVESQHA